MCDPFVFAHLQCRLEPRKLNGANLGSCWCPQRARRFGQRELPLSCAWKSFLTVACFVFPFLLWLTLLTCNGCASMTATLAFSEAFGVHLEFQHTALVSFNVW